MDVRPPGMGRFKKPPPRAECAFPPVAGAPAGGPPPAFGAARGVASQRGGVPHRSAAAAAGPPPPRSVRFGDGLGPRGGGGGDSDSGDGTATDDDVSDGDEVDEAMVADMQRATGMEYDQVVRLLREYSSLKRQDAHGGSDDDDTADGEGSSPAAPPVPKVGKVGKHPSDASQPARRGSRSDDGGRVGPESPRHPDATSGRSVPRPLPPPSAEGGARGAVDGPIPRRGPSAVTMPPGDHPTMPATSAADDARAQKHRLQSQLDDLLGDISAARATEEAERLAAERVIAEAKEREERRAQEATASTLVRRGPVETPASLRARNAFTERYEAETEQRRAAREDRERLKREAAELEALERREKGIFVNMALKKKIASGSHLAPRKGAAANASAQGQVTRDLRATDPVAGGGSARGKGAPAFIAIDLDEDGLPTLID